MVVEISLEEWKDFILQQTNVQVFHHPNWINLLTTQYHYKRRIFAWKENGNIQAAIPFLETQSLFGERRLVCLPFTDFLYPVNQNQTAIGLLIQFLKNNNIGIDEIELRMDLADYNLAFNSSYLKHELQLSANFDDIYSKFASSAKRNIKKAVTNHIITKKYTDQSGIDIFYKLHLYTRKKHGIPIQPKKFFSYFKNFLFDQNMGFILVAFKSEIPVAAALFLYYGKTLVYKYGASDEKFLEFRPNDLIFNEAIKWGCENQFQLFDFGTSACDNTGLRRYKSAWGAEETPVNYFYINKRKQAPRFKKGKSNFLKVIIQHSPLWVCRITGELFYKYAN